MMIDLDVEDSTVQDRRPPEEAPVAKEPAQDWNNYQLRVEPYGPGESADGPANEVGYLSWGGESVENGEERHNQPHLDYAAIRRNLFLLCYQRVS